MLSLDFDGVLHRTHADGELTIATAGYGELQEERPDLFGWTPHLVAALGDQACDLIVHSSWRAYLSERDLRAVLPPVLRRRFIGVTNTQEGREASILSAMRRMGLQEHQVLVLDDEPNQFSALRSRVLVCAPDKGVSDLAVQRSLQAWLIG